MPDSDLQGLDDFLAAQEADQLRYVEELPPELAPALWNAIVARSERAGDGGGPSLHVLGRILVRAGPKEYQDPTELRNAEPAGGLSKHPTIFPALSASLIAAPAAKLNEEEIPQQPKNTGVAWVKRQVTALLNWFERRGLREKAATISLKDGFPGRECRGAAIMSGKPAFAVHGGHHHAALGHRDPRRRPSGLGGQSRDPKMRLLRRKAH
jgi:hypothetical protein